jgi:hypothetical protein
MTIDELIPLTNGLSITACGQTLVCDRTRITPINDSIDMKFWIAGTDYVPRLRLAKARLASASAETITRILRRVVQRTVCG